MHKFLYLNFSASLGVVVLEEAQSFPRVDQEREGMMPVHEDKGHGEAERPQGCRISETLGKRKTVFFFFFFFRDFLNVVL